MKKILLAIYLVGMTIPTAFSESFNVTVGNITYSAPVKDCGDMTYFGGQTLTILDKAFNLADITAMTVTDNEVAANTILMSYSESSVSVTVDARIARYVDVSVVGAKVSIDQSAYVSADTCGEITYILQGNSSDGAFYMSGSFKSTIVLNGLTLTNISGAPIDIQNGKRIKLKVADGTSNTLTDDTGGAQKGCIVCKGHLEIQGSGSLEVNANTAHGIYAKEYITLKNADVKVSSAVKDGLNCNQYFEMKSGMLDISGVGDDGIQVSFKDDTDSEEEDTGSIIVSGGRINVEATATAAKAIKADGNIFITGGNITASVSGGGKWDSSSVKTKAASCLSADGNMTISGGTLNLTATGSAGKGISVDGDFYMTDGDVAVSTSGGIFAYVNGKEYTNYNGNTDNLDSNYKSSPKGIKADSNVTIDGGKIKVTTTGNGGEGIESKAVMTINGGEIVINSNDDGLNSANHMYLKGGDITVVATNNDAIDSNGNLYVQGGTIRAFGARAPECGIDANEEEGYTVIFTGGTLIAVGGNNSTPRTSESTQPYVSGSSSLTAGDTVTLKSGNTVLASYTVPDNYATSGGGFGGGPGGGGPGGNGRNSSVLITCAGLSSGSSYTLTSGNASTTVKAQLKGNSGNRPW